MADCRIIINASADKSRELDKRFYVPGVIVEAKCPDCGEVKRCDLGRNYLSYPVIGEPTPVYFYCPNEHQWTEHVVVRIGIEVSRGE